MISTVPKKWVSLQHIVVYFGTVGFQISCQHISISTGLKTCDILSPYVTDRILGFYSSAFAGDPAFMRGGMLSSSASA
jgi:hypothetical protein